MRKHDRKNGLATVVFAVATLLVSSVMADESVPILIDPSVLTLGSGETSRVSVDLPRGAKRVEIFTIWGTIKKVRVVAKGKATAVYTPPLEFLPRVDTVAVLITFKDGDRAWGFANTTLIGQGEAVIKTRPFARAVIRIGDREFESAKANRRGKAKVRVEVPPGINKGYDERDEEVDLHVPPTARTAMFGIIANEDSDEEAAWEVMVVVHTSKGERDVNSIPVLTSQDGTVGELKAMGQGVYRASFHPVASTEGGKLAIESIIDGVEAPPFVLELAEPEEDEGAEISEGGGSGEPLGNGGSAEDERKDVPWIGTGLKVGYSSNMGALNLFSLALDVNVKIPIWDHGLSLGAEVGFSRTSDEGDVSLAEDSSSSTNTRTWLVPIAGVISYRITLGESWNLVPFAVGAGVLIDNEIKLSTAGNGVPQTNHERSYQFGVGGGAALEYRLGSGALFLQVDFLGITGTPGTVQGNLSLLSIRLGYRVFPF